jgi:hypothetical protein
MLRALVAGLALVGLAQQASSQTFSADELARRTIERRAVEAVIWGMPAVSSDLLRQAAIHEARGGENQIVYWSGLPSWKNQTLTPNPDAVYLMPFFNTRAGPMVLEIPPASDEGSITGNIDNVWQVPLEDVGPEGVDKGKGGKFLILPPGYKDKNLRVTSRFPPKPMAVSPCCAPFSRAGLTPTSPKRSPTASGPNSIL